MTNARGGNREALRANVEKLVDSYLDNGENAEKLKSILSRPGITLPLGLVARLYGSGLDSQAREASARYQAMVVKSLATSNALTGMTVKGARMKFNLPDNSGAEDVFDAIAGWAPAQR